MPEYIPRDWWSRSVILGRFANSWKKQQQEKSRNGNSGEEIKSKLNWDLNRISKKTEWTSLIGKNWNFTKKGQEFNFPRSNCFKYLSANFRIHPTPQAWKAIEHLDSKRVTWSLTMPWRNQHPWNYIISYTGLSVKMQEEHHHLKFNKKISYKKYYIRSTFADSYIHNQFSGMKCGNQIEHQKES